jgi:AcrR family transcriptional regulator
MFYTRQGVSRATACILCGVPRLWEETVDAHRLAVREATLDATATLVAEHGLRAVTMSRIAEATGIGRATLYKYFADVEAVLAAWHERQVHRHLQQMTELRDGEGALEARLEAVLMTYAASIGHADIGSQLAAGLHQGAHMAEAQHHLHSFLASMVAEGAESGVLRGDVAPQELASYCLSALGAASALPSKAAVGRLVDVVVDGLRPPHRNP